MASVYTNSFGRKSVLSPLSLSKKEINPVDFSPSILSTDILTTRHYLKRKQYIRSILTNKKKSTTSLNLNSFIQISLETFFKNILEQECMSPTRYGFQDDDLSFEQLTQSTSKDKVLSELEFFSLKQIELFDKFETIYHQLHYNNKKTEEASFLN